MKTTKQRTESILRKAKKEGAKRKAIRLSAIASCAMVAVTALNLFLFLPFSTENPTLKKYEGSEYYSVIRTVDELIPKSKPKYKNNYEKYIGSFFDRVFSFGCGDANGGAGMDTFPPAMDDEVDSDQETLPGATPDGSAGGYVETTDNQVAGVIEGDLLKRTNTHLFYLDISARSVYIYDIAGTESKQVSTVYFATPGMYYNHKTDMYLTEDGNTMTIVQSGTLEKKAYTIIKSYDIRNPEQVRFLEDGYLSGSYLSSRMADGKLLVFNNYAFTYLLNYDDLFSFIPHYGDSVNNCELVSSGDILCPEKATESRYTVVAEVDPTTARITDAAAFLSYSTGGYVSSDNIFLTRGYIEQESLEDNEKVERDKTDIACVSYGEGLDYKGSVSVNGRVKNQYSMDEYEGILRVATSTAENRYKLNTLNNYYYDYRTEKNGGLYCIDLNTFSIIGKAEGFAPNETVESARFDKEKAYLCTAEVIQFTDPVFVFDLTDPQNITYKDTGVIDGYSSSLITFGDYLLGVGFSGSGGLKIEVYEETATAVESVCSYELDTTFASEYKSYFIDRERSLIGLAVGGSYDGNDYILLQFTGTELVEVVRAPFSWRAQLNNFRACLIDGYFYILGNGADNMKVYGLGAQREEKFYSLQEGYDTGALTKEDLQHITYYHSGKAYGLVDETQPVSFSNVTEVDFTPTRVLESADEALLTEIAEAYYTKAFTGTSYGSVKDIYVRFLGEYNGYIAVSIDSFLWDSDTSIRVDAVAGVAWYEQNDLLFLYKA